MPDDSTELLLEQILGEVEDLGSVMPRQALAELLERRGHDLDPGTPGRAAWLCHAAESWELANQPRRARSCYEEAIHDGGPTWIDPRATLIGVLLDLDEDAQADGLAAAIRRDLAQGPPQGPVFEYVGESLETHERPEDALRWYDAGLGYATRNDPGRVELGCLNGRYRIRRHLGLPHDRWDVICEEERRAVRADLERRQAERAAEPGRREVRRMVVLHWPAEQYPKVLERWPQMRESHGMAHSEHTRVLERHLRRLVESGLQVEVADGDVEEYLAWAKEDDADPAESATRAAYGAHLGFLRRGRPWPPGRNGPCWCGSGRKYKKCCGALRFPAEDEQ